MANEGIMGNRADADSSVKRGLLAAGLILALTLLAYSNSFVADFHFDDFHTVVKNQNVRSLANVPRFFTDAGMASYAADLKGYRPVTYTTYALNYALSGYHVWSYHLFNILLHFLNVFLVYIIVSSVLKKSGRNDVYLSALAVAVLFALHPIQTNSVTYVSGRALLLAGMFTLLAFYVFLRFRASGGYFRAAAIPVIFLLGLLSKETAVCLVGFMLVYDLLFTVPESGGFLKSVKAWLLYMPMAAVLVAYLLYKKHLTGFVAVDELDYGVWQYLMSEAKVLLMYLRLLVLPINQNVDYDLPATLSFGPKVAVSAVLTGFMFYGLYRIRKRDRAAAFFGFWFFIAIAPESTLIPIRDIAVEYRLYMPSAGFIAALFLLASAAMKQVPARRAVAVVVIVLLGVLTFNRNSVWATEYTLWTDVVRKSPESARSHANYGNALLGRKDYEAAVGELNRSLDIDPFYDHSYNVFANLGICYFELGMTEDAITAFERAITVNPGYMEGYANLGAVYYKLGRYNEAVDVLYKATRLDPGYSQSHYNLAQSYNRLGRKSEALTEMEQALSFSPKDYDINYNLAIIYQENGMPAEAEEQARRAVSVASGEEQVSEAEALVSRMSTARAHPKGSG